MHTQCAAAAQAQAIPPAEFAATEATAAVPPVRCVIHILIIKTLTQTKPFRYLSVASAAAARMPPPKAPAQAPPATCSSASSTHAAGSSTTQYQGSATHMPPSMPLAQGLQSQAFTQAPPAQTRPSGSLPHTARSSIQGPQPWSSSQAPSTNPFSQTCLTTGQQTYVQYTFQVETQAAVQEWLNTSPSHNTQRNHKQANAIMEICITVNCQYICIDSDLIFSH